MTTNNHPANGPVSLERLHQIRETLSKAAAQSDGGNIGYAMSDAVKVIDGAIAAFGTEPVAYMTYKGYLLHAADPKLAEYSDPTPLYTAPPAPVSVPDAMEMDDDFDSAFEHGKAVGWNAYRAAMLQSFGNSEQLNSPVIPDGWKLVPVEPTEEMNKAGWTAMNEHDAINPTYRAMLAAAPDFRENAETSTKCWCRTCRPVKISDMRFVVCPDCGNKRCPHANDHRNACTGSNETGQEGSAYPAAPQQEVK
ncbi:MULTISPECIES: hypothetical protein [Enterobacter cloacae complex]|uniref:hypothetical protein n=1 Tax=Enterobacter cloacae complex TaxID=354276 RepID=UPI00044637BF|nr:MULTISPECIES: hypothetical protein [Enterobacter cloacae complex]EUM98069.1 hypothetical protein L350_05736 [Enterobacter sp. MGH 4]